MPLKLPCPVCGRPTRLVEPYPLPGTEIQCYNCGTPLAITYPPGVVDKLKQRGKRFQTEAEAAATARRKAAPLPDARQSAPPVRQRTPTPPPSPPRADDGGSGGSEGWLDDFLSPQRRPRRQERREAAPDQADPYREAELRDQLGALRQETYSAAEDARIQAARAREEVVGAGASGALATGVVEAAQEASSRAERARLEADRAGGLRQLAEAVHVARDARDAARAAATDARRAADRAGEEARAELEGRARADRSRRETLQRLRQSAAALRAEVAEAQSEAEGQVEATEKLLARSEITTDAVRRAMRVLREATARVRFARDRADRAAADALEAADPAQAEALLTSGTTARSDVTRALDEAREAAVACRASVEAEEEARRQARQARIDETLMRLRERAALFDSQAADAVARVRTRWEAVSASARAVELDAEATRALDGLRGALADAEDARRTTAEVAESLSRLSDPREAEAPVARATAALDEARTAQLAAEQHADLLDDWLQSAADRARDRAQVVQAAAEAERVARDVAGRIATATRDTEAAAARAAASGRHAEADQLRTASEHTDAASRRLSRTAARISDLRRAADATAALEQVQHAAAEAEQALVECARAVAAEEQAHHQAEELRQEQSRRLRERAEALDTDVESELARIRDRWVPLSQAAHGVELDGDAVAALTALRGALTVLEDAHRTTSRVRQSLGTLTDPTEGELLLARARRAADAASTAQDEALAHATQLESGIERAAAAARDREHMVRTAAAAATIARDITRDLGRARATADVAASHSAEVGLPTPDLGAARELAEATVREVESLARDVAHASTAAAADTGLAALQARTAAARDHLAALAATARAADEAASGSVRRHQALSALQALKARVQEANQAAAAARREVAASTHDAVRTAAMGVLGAASRLETAHNRAVRATSALEGNPSEEIVTRVTGLVAQADSAWSDLGTSRRQLARALDLTRAEATERAQVAEQRARTERLAQEIHELAEDVRDSIEAAAEACTDASEDALGSLAAARRARAGLRSQVEQADALVQAAGAATRLDAAIEITRRAEEALGQTRELVTAASRHAASATRRATSEREERLAATRAREALALRQLRERLSEVQGAAAHNLAQVHEHAAATDEAFREAGHTGVLAGAARALRQAATRDATTLQDAIERGLAATSPVAAEAQLQLALTAQEQLLTTLERARIQRQEAERAAEDHLDQVREASHRSLVRDLDGVHASAQRDLDELRRRVADLESASEGSADPRIQELLEQARAALTEGEGHLDSVTTAAERGRTGGLTVAEAALDLAGEAALSLRTSLHGARAAIDSGDALARAETAARRARDEEAHRAVVLDSISAGRRLVDAAAGRCDTLQAALRTHLITEGSPVEALEQAVAGTARARLALTSLEGIARAIAGSASTSTLAEQATATFAELRDAAGEVDARCAAGTASLEFLLAEREETTRTLETARIAVGQAASRIAELRGGAQRHVDAARELVHRLQVAAPEVLDALASAEDARGQVDEAAAPIATLQRSADHLQNPAEASDLQARATGLVATVQTRVDACLRQCERVESSGLDEARNRLRGDITRTARQVIRIAERAGAEVERARVAAEGLPEGVLAEALAGVRTKAQAAATAAGDVRELVETSRSTDDPNDLRRLVDRAARLATSARGAAELATRLADHVEAEATEERERLAEARQLADARAHAVRERDRAAVAVATSKELLQSAHGALDGRTHPALDAPLSRLEAHVARARQAQAEAVAVCDRAATESHATPAATLAGRARRAADRTEAELAQARESLDALLTVLDSLPEDLPSEDLPSEEPAEATVVMPASVLGLPMAAPPPPPTEAATRVDPTVAAADAPSLPGIDRTVASGRTPWGELPLEIPEPEGVEAHPPELEPTRPMETHADADAATVIRPERATPTAAPQAVPAAVVPKVTAEPQILTATAPDVATEPELPEAVEASLPEPAVPRPDLTVPSLTAPALSEVQTSSSAEVVRRAEPSPSDVPTVSEQPAPPTSAKKPKKKRSFLGRLARFSLAATVVLGLTGLAAAAGGYWYYSQDLPTLEALRSYQPPTVTVVYDHQGRVLGEIYEERRYVVPLEDIPDHVQDAFVAAEDANFWNHGGVDYMGILRAMGRNLKDGRMAQGASTITQQVTRNFLLTREKKLERKIKEVILAWRIEKAYDKEHILYLYLNEIYLGSQAYGVEAASRTYFDKHVSELTIAEAAILAGLPQRPSDYSPHRHWAKARARQEYVLRQMLRRGYIDQAEYDAALAEDVRIVKRRNVFLEQAPHFTEYARRHLVERYGEDRVLNEGLQVTTTCDLDLQRVGQEAVSKQVHAVDQRMGFRREGLTTLPAEQIQAKRDEHEEALRQAWAVAQDAAGRVEPPAVSILEAGTVYEGVILEVERGWARAAIGAHEGIIPLAWSKWVFKPNPRRSWRYREQTDLREQVDVDGDRQNDGSILQVGDVVQLKVMNLSTQDDEVSRAFRRTPGETEDLLALHLWQEPEIEGAMLSFDLETGAVRTMVGGSDFTKSQFNRAIQSRRQVGSTFKPIVYGAAIESKKVTTATMVADAPIAFAATTNDFIWKPANYGHDYLGNIPLRKALALSRNTCTIRILESIDPGMNDDVVYSFARRLGIGGPPTHTLPPDWVPSPDNDLLCPWVRETAESTICMDRYPPKDPELTNTRHRQLMGPDDVYMCRACDMSLGLGSASLTMQELLRAYSAFATSGYLVEPYYIEEVRDRSGNVLEHHEPQPFEQVLDPAVASIVRWLLRGVVTGGTAARASRMGIDIGGKTGTTNDEKDTWFVGFNTRIIAAAWVGYDQPRTLGVSSTGGRTALPIWMEYMTVAAPKDQNEPFRYPGGLEWVQIDEETGRRVTSGGRSHPFLPGTVPEPTGIAAGQISVEDLATEF